VTIPSQTTNGNEFSVESGFGENIPINPGASHPVKWKFTPQSLPGLKRATLKITSNDPDSPSVEVALRGRAVLSNISRMLVFPQTPDPFNFGLVALGESSDSKAFVVRNDGGTGLDVTASIEGLDAGDFYFIEGVNPSFVLNPGDAESFEVGFNPASEDGTERLWKVDALAAFSVHQIAFDTFIITEEKGIQTKTYSGIKEKGEVKNFTADLGFANAENLDLTKIFYPYGLHVLAGSTFYFSSEEIFSKPGAKVVIETRMRLEENNDNTVAVTTGGAGPNNGSTGDPGVTKIPHTVVWEYWNGREWTELVADFTATSVGETPSSEANAELKALNHPGKITFDVPYDFKKNIVNEEENFWVRVRVLTGTFGIRRKVVYQVETDTKPVTNELFITEQIPPAIAEFAMGYTYESPRVFFDHCLALNDFQYVDYTANARSPGSFFLPFQQLRDITPALYIGFDKKLPVDFLQLFYHIEEDRGDDAEGPELTWEFWNGFQWREFQAEDETGNLKRPGMVSFIGPEQSQPLARFGTSLHWLRARRREDGPPVQSKVLQLHHNAVWVSQRQKIHNEILGASSGLPNQTFRFNHIPVLAEEVVEVRELSGPIAHIEFPILTEKLSGDRVRAVRNSEGRVTEVWVRWESKMHLLSSGPEDRHYAVNRANGRIFFGDGERGKIPPINGDISVWEYLTGGGKAGNVAANSITQLLVGVPGVQAVFNLLPAEGGAETETAEKVKSRGPLTLRHRGRAMTARDYEVMVRDASSEVAWVRVFPAMDPNFRKKPGHVTIMILPESKEARPFPSFGLRERVREYIEASTLANLPLMRSIHVIGPDYFEIGVNATIIPVEADEAGMVDIAVRQALADFFHPLSGGPDGTGWELGRDVFLSDVAALLEAVEGVDFVEELFLLRDDTPQGERVAVPPERLVVGGDIRIKIKISE
jgi:hypothetical protein